MARTEPIEIPFATTGDKEASQRLTAFGKSLAELAENEKKAFEKSNAKKHYAELTDAQKDALVSMKKYADEQERLSKSEQDGRKGAINSWTEFRSAYSAVIDVVKQGTEFVMEAYGEYGKLVETVRDLSLVSGMSAEESSRFVNVLSDFDLTADDATKAAQALKEQGLSPSIETIIQLSKEFKNIQDPAERLDFIQKNLGGSGSKWVNILNQEEDALRSMNSEVGESFVLSEKQIAEYERQKQAIDALSDSWEGFKLDVGAAFGEVVLSLDKGSEAFRRADEAMRNQGITVTDGVRRSQKYKDALLEAEQAIEAEINAQIKSTETNQAASVSTEELAEQQKKLAEQNKKLSEQLQSQISLIDKMQSAEDAYTEKSQSLAEQRAEAEANLAEIKRQGWWDGSKQMQDAISKVEDIKDAEAKLAEERAKQSLQFISNILQEQLARDGWTQAEFDAFAKQQEAWGLWSADTVAKSKAAWEEANKITAAINGIPAEKNVTINLITAAQAQANVTASGSANYVQQLGTQVRDSGGSGDPGSMYMIGKGAQPEMFIPSTAGQFIPNADKLIGGNTQQKADPETNALLRKIANQKPMDEAKLARLVRDIALQRG